MRVVHPAPRDALHSVPIIVLIGLALAGCRAAAPVQSQPLSDAESAVRLRDGRTTARQQVVTTVWSRRAGEWRRIHLYESWQPSDEPAQPPRVPIRVRLP